jgi:hypothetical protein
MVEALKSRIILILSLVNVIFLIGLVGSCNNASQQKAAWRKEMLSRLDSEDKLNKITQKHNVVAEDLNLKEKELVESNAALTTVKKELAQEQLVSQSLKEELQKIVKLKEVLEDDLKKALSEKSKQQ